MDPSKNIGESRLGGNESKEVNSLPLNRDSVVIEMEDFEIGEEEVLLDENASAEDPFMDSLPIMPETDYPENMPKVDDDEDEEIKEIAMTLSEEELVRAVEDADNVGQESSFSTGNVDVFDSQDDEFLVGIPEDSFQNDMEDEAAAASASNSVANEEALKWLNKMKVIEEEQNENFKTLRKFSGQVRMFPDVRCSNFHTVAFVVTTDYQVGDHLVPFPNTFTSKWDPAYVPIPCCVENNRIVKVRKKPSSGNNGEVTEAAEEPAEELKRVFIWERVTRQLTYVPFTTCHDIYTAMKYYTYTTGGPFNVLEYAVETLMTPEEKNNFYSKVLPWIAKMCLDLKKIVTSPLPLLTRYKNYSISLSQVQIACLLANSFFSTFPKRGQSEESYATINFNGLFTSSTDSSDARFVCRAQKIRCILHYFERLEKEIPCGVVTFTRKSIQNSKLPDWKNSTKSLTKMVVLSKGTIEKEGAGTLQVDFANRYIGGGVLGDGAVQEEILFVIYPELLVARLFTENLASSEALVVTGCERFSDYYGYARNFSYAGDFIDCTPYDAKGRRCTQIVAIDALYIRNKVEQFHPQKLLRELNKAYVGFSSPNPAPVAISTGKWGCGAFNGDPELKSIIQFLAASEAGRDLVMFTFGDTKLQDTMLSVIDVIKDMSIQEVWKLLNQYYSVFCTVGKPTIGIGRFFLQFGKSGLPADLKTPEPTPKSLKQVSISQFYSKGSLSSDSKVVSNFPKPKENIKVKTPIPMDNEGGGWINADKKVKEKSQASSSSSANAGSKDGWLESLESFKYNFASRNVKPSQTSPASVNINSRKDKEGKSYFSKELTEEEIAAAMAADSQDMEYDNEPAAEGDKEKAYRDAFRNSSPVLLKRPKTSADADCRTPSSENVSGRSKSSGLKLTDFY